jgi:hypothetical protein
VRFLSLAGCFDYKLVSISTPEVVNSTESMNLTRSRKDLHTCVPHHRYDPNNRSFVFSMIYHNYVHGYCSGTQSAMPYQVISSFFTNVALSSVNYYKSHTKTYKAD